MSEYRSWDRCDRQISIFIRPYHVREEDKKVIDKEMTCLCYLGFIENQLKINTGQKSGDGL